LCLFYRVGLIFLSVNIYVPYIDQNIFWESFFQNPLLKDGIVVMGGDLNFTLGASEVWGPTAHLDPLAYFFLSQLEEMGCFGHSTQN
jgi:hypothetical protein